MRPASRGETFLACAAGLIVGGFVSLFTAGPALFADGAFEQRPPVLAASVVVFAVVGVVIGLAAPGAWKPAAICLALSAVPVVVLFGRDTFAQRPMALLSLGFVLGDAAAGLFGAWGGARIRFARGSGSESSTAVSDEDRSL
jgi:hypothetical protein